MESAMAGDAVKSLKELARKREKFAVPIKCCKCDQVGSATWAENAGVSSVGPQAKLLGVSNGFYGRLQKKNYSRSEIVCAVCETIVLPV
jgi:hypothetical protein